MAKKAINKIVYFDKETIRNILQERDHGELSRVTDVSSSMQNQASVASEASATLKLDVPFISRISFLFTGKIGASYVLKRDNTTTISSTEISEFEKLKPLLTSIPTIQLSDIENSSTSLRVAGGYLKIVKGGIEGVDTKEFKTVMDNDIVPSDFGNSLTFSNEYIKQYQTICSEIDVLMKSICRELGDTSANDMKDGYTPTILNRWSVIKQQKVKMKDIELQPFINWEYYLVLEKDFLETEQYVSLELGDNYLYNDIVPSDFGNSLTFSNEYIKQYQTICSEIDVLMKSICRELGDTSANDMKDGYTPTILNRWSVIKQQKVKMKDIELQPFINWEDSPNYKSPDWWTPYNKVKHERVTYFKKANLKNVLNALAGLFVLENYIVKFIGDRDNDVDVPNDISRIFEMVDFPTRENVIGRNTYTATEADIDSLFD